MEKRNPLANSPEGIIGNAPFDKSAFANDSWAEEQPTTIGAYQEAYKGDAGKALRDFTSKLTGQERWLDLGSGFGSSIIHLLQKDGKITNPVYLDLDKRNLTATIGPGFAVHGGSKINADAAALPLKEKSIDFLVSVLMMGDNEVNKIEKKEFIQREMMRVLKDGGVYIGEQMSDIIDKKKFEHLFDFNAERMPLEFYRKKKSP